MQKQSQPIRGKELRPQARTKDLVVSPLPDEELVYDLKTHQAFCLNKIAAAVWDGCDGETTVAEMSRALSHELGTEVNEEWVWFALRELNRSSLLEPGIVWPEKMSRRMLLRKLGTSALAIPVVMAIVAPAAAQAASCGNPNNSDNQNPNGCSCNGADDCVSECCGTGNICIATASVPIGSSCSANCGCVNSCCGFGNICVTLGSVPSGGLCRAGCECASGSCPTSPSPRRCA